MNAIASGWNSPLLMSPCGAVSKKVPNSQPWRAGSFSWTITIGKPDSKAAPTSVASASPTDCRKAS
eukprot:1439681-Prymnesium_polylepis.1